ELPILGNIDRIEPVSTKATREGAPVERVVFGPTCDSLDRLPGLVPLAGILARATGWSGTGLGPIPQRRSRALTAMARLRWSQRIA
ncbi:MAG: hypothetical protein KJO30_08705, partial [Boseongicola sp.]|nr:hypothetical protein [Boseongicola sp.]